MNSRPYTVHVYQGEAELISKWTLQYTDIETGGDIFGLWLNENEVVIQAVLGPGQNCRRTATSFFQDEQYLSKVGGLLTNNEGLCNVGSWHSHHTMNLPEPSRGDKDTVWRHLPTPGRFLLLIATIERRRDGPIVQMSFNLFEATSKGNEVTRMKLEILEGQSPIRANTAVSSQMFIGAEVPSKKPSYPVPSGPNKPEVNKKSREMKPEMKVQQRSESRSHSGVDRDDRSRTCDGVRYVQRPYPSRNEFYYDWKDISGGRQRMVYFHIDHEVGGCPSCRNTEIYRQRDGAVIAETPRPPQYEDYDEDPGCCVIL